MCGHHKGHNEKRKSDQTSACGHGKSPIAHVRNRDGVTLLRFPVWPVIGFLSFAIWWLPNPLLLIVGVIGIALVTGLQVDFNQTDKVKRKPKNDDPYYEL